MAATATTATTRGGAERPPAVKIIETVHVEADRSSFKSVVQRLTGRDAVVGDWSDGSESEAAAQGFGFASSRQSSKAFTDGRHPCKEESSG